MEEAPSYYHHTERPEVLPYVPAGLSEVLEVGCAAGGFGRLLMTRDPDVRVDGVELDEAAAAEAALAYREVLVGEFPKVRPNRTYDAVVCNDVLEHIVDPWAAARTLRALVNRDGIVVASIPNMRHWYTLRALLRGRWDYRGAGVMDKTHLRWFTRATMCELFTDAGFEIRSIESLHTIPANFKWQAARRILPRLSADLMTEQYVVVASTTRQ